MFTDVQIFLMCLFVAVYSCMGMVLAIKNLMEFGFLMLAFESIVFIIGCLFFIFILFVLFGWYVA